MYYIGIDLGTNIAIGLVDEEGNIVHKDSVPTLGNRKQDGFLKDMAMLSLKVIKDGVSIDDVKSIGVGSWVHQTVKRYPCIRKQYKF